MYLFIGILLSYNCKYYTFIVYAMSDNKQFLELFLFVSFSKTKKKNKKQKFSNLL